MVFNESSVSTCANLPLWIKCHLNVNRALVLLVSRSRCKYARNKTSKSSVCQQGLLLDCINRAGIHTNVYTSCRHTSSTYNEIECTSGYVPCGENFCEDYCERYLHSYYILASEIRIFMLLTLPQLPTVLQYYSVNSHFITKMLVLSLEDVTFTTP